MIKILKHDLDGSLCRKNYRCINGITELDILFDDSVLNYSDQTFLFHISPERHRSDDPSVLIQLYLWPESGLLSHVKLMYNYIADRHSSLLSYEAEFTARRLYFDMASFLDGELSTMFSTPTIRVDANIDVTVNDGHIIAIVNDSMPHKSIICSSGDKIIFDSDNNLVGIDFIR